MAPPTSMHPSIAGPTHADYYQRVTFSHGGEYASQAHKTQTSSMRPSTANNVHEQRCDVPISVDVAHGGRQATSQICWASISTALKDISPEHKHN